MSEAAQKRAVPATRTRNLNQPEWQPTSHPVVVGKDVLELLSSSMYVDPMTIYREYVQNSADAIDVARDQGLFSKTGSGRVDIAVDPMARSIRVRDNGTGIAAGQFAERLSNLGASAKRGTPARGFRGVGRLAGLGYCQELIFRSRTEEDPFVSELRWDCRALKSVLRSARQDQHLTAIVHAVISLRRTPAIGFPKRFFEVELRGVVRHRNDRLLNPAAVHDYLAQVAPVPFAPEFKFGSEISAALRPHVRLGEIALHINDAEQPVYRPHRDTLETGPEKFDDVLNVEVREIGGVDGGVGAIAWIAHHGYAGAIPTKTLIKGIRLRSGNMQVGDHALLEELFAEPRFNAWGIGEVHIVDPKILPNGRRDHFEQSVHFDNLLNQLTPNAREITRRCRQSSAARKWLREFELHKGIALDKAKVVARGGLSKAARRTHTGSVANALKAMRRVVNTRHLGDDTREQLATQAETVEARVSKLLGDEPQGHDPLARFKPQSRAAYQHVISLIYECSRNTSAASALVSHILARLDAQAESAQTSRRVTKKKRKSKAKR